MKELAKNFDPSAIEERLYETWMKRKYFHTEVDRSKKPYCIVMPPPNITGQLHMGHALDNTMQDILIRWKRMAGFNALWVPGIDHASISTEVKVAQKMAEEGNPASVSDAGVGALAARAAVRGACLNVKINAAGLKNRALADELVARAEAITAEAERLEADVLKTVESKI